MSAHSGTMCEKGGGVKKEGAVSENLVDKVNRKRNSMLDQNPEGFLIENYRSRKKRCRLFIFSLSKC